MRKLRTLFFFEMYHFLITPAFYTICAAFALLMGAIFVFALQDYARFQQEDPLMLLLFKTMWLPMLFIIPIFTTRAIVREKIAKTLDLTLLLKVSNFAVIFSKFLAIFWVYVGLWSLTLTFPLIAKHFAISVNPIANFSSVHLLVGGLFFVSLVGAAAISMGLLIGVYSRTQATAFAVYFISLFTFLISGQIFKKVMTLSDDNSFFFASLYDNFNVFFQLEDFCRGIIDTRVVWGYFSVTLAFLSIAALSLRKG